jgi:hypothetical protein
MEPAITKKGSRHPLALMAIAATGVLAGIPPGVAFEFFDTWLMMLGAWGMKYGVVAATLVGSLIFWIPRE